MNHTLNRHILSPFCTHFSPSASVIARNEVPKQSRTNNESLLCLCLQQSGLWILDVARPVGRALKDDGKVGECILVASPVKWIAASVVLRTLSSQ
jgi:hypothetical protein